MFAMISTRPDISTAVSLLSRHVRNPKKIHCNLLQHVFRYARYIIQYKHQALLILKKLVLGLLVNKAKDGNCLLWIKQLVKCLAWFF